MRRNAASSKLLLNAKKTHNKIAQFCIKKKCHLKPVAINVKSCLQFRSKLLPAKRVATMKH